jgi:hypothetical protein
MLGFLAAALGCATASDPPGAHTRPGPPGALPATPAPSAVAVPDPAVDLSAFELAHAPAALRAQAERAIDARQPDLAYRYLAALHALHPRSPEAAEAFPLAAALFKRAYDRHRFTDPGSIWVRAEPAFLFHWLGSFYEDGSPEEAAKALLLGASYGLFREFEAFAASDPRMRGWKLSVRDDNGIIEAVSARRATDVP